MKVQQSVLEKSKVTLLKNHFKSENNLPTNIISIDSIQIPDRKSTYELKYRQENELDKINEMIHIES